ncbi:hypothetical protein SASPL_134499 [Salvia splendens]|uniref:Phorbol-ester/DAG-type domain-containing protein n=1 Tax=Salvia splendens TaxID=180675 RepID=A0A8X8X4Y5_SALSN|nr:hypothetical protein SASPL_134499 [Salvia splendens]
MSENGMKSEVILHHFLHQHPLILTVADATGYDRPRCDVCGCEIFSGDTIYKCSHDNCSSDHRITLHKECAERPREISLSSHPQHSLIQNKLPYTRDVETWDVPTLIPPSCAVCTHMIEGGKGYSCSSCNFYIHIGNTVDVDPDVVVCPIKDIAEEVIGPFVRKSGMAAISNVDEFVKCKNEFHNPDHQLRIISSSPCHQQKEKEDEDDDDLNYPRRSRILSAWYQSITEFAQRYDGMTLHQYPVAYQLTNKLRCSICGVRKISPKSNRLYMKTTQILYLHCL